MEPLPAPLLPDYGGACIDGVVPALLARNDPHPPPWLPPPAVGADQVVLLVLDGLGWDQLRERASLAPALSAMVGQSVTSVAPTTTATALTSLCTGLPPARHGVVGYRVRVGEGDVLNVLRWSTPAGDARNLVPPAAFQPAPAFGGLALPVVTRAEFASTGFSAAHLAGARLVGWRVLSTLVTEVRRLLREGEPLVYAYYDGVDKVAHEYGLGDHYDAEVAAVDRLAADLVDALPAGAALVVTSDHGQVDVGPNTVSLAPDLTADVILLSGEGRFRWLHARPGHVERLATRVAERLGHLAWVVTRDQAVEEGWFGGPLSAAVSSRLGDVALVARAPVAFLDPADTGEFKLVSRHGSMTPAEVLVPLVGLRSSVRPPSAAQDRARMGKDQAMSQQPPQPEHSVVIVPGPTVIPEAGVAQPERGAGLPGPPVGGADAGSVPAEVVEQPAKVMRIGSMIKQLLEEMRHAPLDEAGRARLREIHEIAVRELAEGLSPDLREELDRLARPFANGATPSEAELRVAHAQMVGWLEGLFHGIQATLFAQQMAARAQLEEMRRRSLPPAGEDSRARPGTYL